MKRNARSSRWPLMLFGLMAVGVNLGGALLFGPENAARIAFAGSTTALVDGLVEQRGSGTLPVIDLRIDADSLRALEADMPYSGRRNIDAALQWGDNSLPVHFRHRGVMLTTHYLGLKRSFRMRMPKRNPFAPIRALNVINPKTQDFLANWLSSAIGQRMGVAVPKDDFAWVRINGRDIGVMETIEQIGVHYEQVHGLSEKKVSVIEGDHPAVVGDSLPVGRDLWASPRNWHVSGKADSAETFHRLSALVNWVNGDDSTATRDSLAKLIDVHAYLKYCAAIQLMGSYHIDDRHNQWFVRSASTGLLYPVLWDAFPLFDPTGGRFHMANDALAFRLLANGDARLERDRELYRIWHSMQVENGVEELLTPTIERLTPAVLSDREKWISAAIGNEHVYRGSDVQWFRSVTNLRRRLHNYWNKLGEGFHINGLQVERQDSALHVRYTGEVSLRMASTTGAFVVLRTSGTGTCAPQADGTTLLIHPAAPVPKDKSARFAQWKSISVLPVDVIIRFNGPVPQALTWSNAVTDEPIAPH